MKRKMIDVLKFLRLSMLKFLKNVFSVVLEDFKIDK